MAIALLLLAVGFILLVKGADWLVEGATAIARRFGVSDLVVGLTVVAFGTSVPEWAVNMIAAIQNHTDLVIGSVIGSNLANTLLILGIAALIFPLSVQKSTAKFDIPFNLVVTVLLLIVANDQWEHRGVTSILSRIDGVLFLILMAFYLYRSFTTQRIKVPDEIIHAAKTGVLQAMFLVCIGIIAVVGGGKLVVDHAVQIAMHLGVSQALIGLTVVAVGTSLPELTTSVIAARKGKADIAVGNVVGSNIFNILWILGTSAIVRPIPFDTALNSDIIILIAATVAMFLIIHSGMLHRRLLLWWKQKDNFLIKRWEGGLLLGLYVCYVAYVVARG
ncbi:MAG TPA: calcium/sodium antiporter [Candidatus Peribacteraceae bacterium]|nr:calcium/sodium antiporter [Candidatus Peribacteraceae bacterium]